jgi:hypothetical protein
LVQVATDLTDLKARIEGHILAGDEARKRSRSARRLARRSCPGLGYRDSSVVPRATTSGSELRWRPPPVTPERQVFRTLWNMPTSGTPGRHVGRRRPGPGLTGPCPACHLNAPHVSRGAIRIQQREIRRERSLAPRGSLMESRHRCELAERRSVASG